MQSEKLQSEIASLNGKVQDLMTENMTFQERLKVIFVISFRSPWEKLFV